MSDEFKPEQVEEEEFEPQTDPKQEEREALQDILQQGKQMGIDPNEPMEHETRTGLQYPTDKDRVTEHKEQYIIPEEEEEFPEEDEPSESEGESEEEKPKKRTPAKPKPAPKKRKPASDSEEESAASESNSDDDDYRPSKGAKGKKAKKGKAGKKKKGSDSDEGSDEDWKASKAKKAGGAKKGAGGGRGYAKPLKLSPELSDLMGEEVAPRHEVVKKVWALIKERNLYDPKNKQFAICDDQFFKVFGVKRFRTFGMMKLLKDHFITE